MGAKQGGGPRRGAAVDPRFDTAKWDLKGSTTSKPSQDTVRARAVSDEPSARPRGDSDDEEESFENSADQVSEDDEDNNEDGDGDEEEASIRLDEEMENPSDTHGHDAPGSPARVVKPLSEHELASFDAKQRKRGIVYISRIPHGMTVAKVRHLLGGFGDIERLYLQDGREKEQGQKLTGRRAKTAHFTEGWVEFVDNRVAKAVAEMLNAEPIGAASGGSGGGKGGKRAGGRGLRRWKDEVWTMKYLSGFKWYMLSEQLANERASRASRVRAELSQSAYEQRDYLRKVERARVMRDKEVRRKAREDKIAGTTSSNGETPSQRAGAASTAEAAKQRSFRQREAVVRDVREMHAKRSHDYDAGPGPRGARSRSGRDDGAKRAKHSEPQSSSHDTGRAQALQGALSKIF